ARCPAVRAIRFGRLHHTRAGRGRGPQTRGPAPHSRYHLYMRPIHRVGVLGAGTMGARIAAHFANAGIPSLLLDLDTAAAKRGIESAIKSRPGAFFVDSAASMITPGSFDEHLSKLAECDWVI